MFKCDNMATNTDYFKALQIACNNVKKAIKWCYRYLITEVKVYMNEPDMVFL